MVRALKSSPWAAAGGKGGLDGPKTSSVDSARPGAGHAHLAASNLAVVLSYRTLAEWQLHQQGSIVQAPLLEAHSASVQYLSRAASVSAAASVAPSYRAEGTMPRARCKNKTPLSGAGYSGYTPELVPAMLKCGIPPRSGLVLRG